MTSATRGCHANKASLVIQKGGVNSWQSFTTSVKLGKIKRHKTTGLLLFYIQVGYFVHILSLGFSLKKIILSVKGKKRVIRI